jgi:spore germination cell wall hydrolase CwlJ-like protein
MIEAIFYLTLALYHEARSEPIKCQALVADVIINRSIYRNKTIKEIILQPHQFSFNKKAKMLDKKSKEIAFTIAVSKQYFIPTNNYQYYHTSNIKPKWSLSMIPKEKCGNHIFY